MEHIVVLAWDLETGGPSSNVQELKTKIENIREANNDLQTSGYTSEMSDRVDRSSEALSEIALRTSDDSLPAAAWEQLMPAAHQLKLDAEQAMSSSIC